LPGRRPPGRARAPRREAYLASPSPSPRTTRFTTVDAAMDTDMEHDVQFTPSPMYPRGHAPHEYPVPGAGISVHATPGKQGASAHPSTSTHPVSPSPEYPELKGHAPQIEPPDPSGVHTVRRSHPPLFTSHALDSTHVVSPEPLYPEGHAPHVRPPGVFAQFVMASHPPLLVAHSSISVQVTPSPSYPAGQAPHSRPPTTFVHATSGKHPPFTRSMSAHSSSSTHPVPCATPSPSNPGGHFPHETPEALPGSAVHLTEETHPPFPKTHGSSFASTS